MPVAKSLFKVSLIFLWASASYLLSYAISLFLNPDFTTTDNSRFLFQLAYIIGTTAFAIGLYKLIAALISFYLELVGDVNNIQ